MNYTPDISSSWNWTLSEKRLGLAIDYHRKAEKKKKVSKCNTFHNLHNHEITELQASQALSKPILKNTNV